MLIKVKAFPNSKKTEIIQKSLDSFDVKVKEKPKNNEANLAIFQILAEYFHIKQSQLRLIKGGKERNKIFEIIENGK
jgi:uncharacterized protein YggU (UPF0235/DUF167 family)